MSGSPHAVAAPMTTVDRAGLWVNFSALVALFAVVCCSSHIYRFGDEYFHLLSVMLLREHGLTREYFQAPTMTSPGPLFAVIQQLAAPITRLDARNMRLVSFSLLLVLMGIFWGLLRRQGARCPVAYALMLMSVPPIYVCAGLALTEMPACVFFYGYVLLALLAHDSPDAAWGRRGLLALAAGLAFGIAVCGRQLFLPTLAAMPLLFTRKSRILDPLVILLAAIPLPLAMFSFWGALSPIHYMSASDVQLLRWQDWSSTHHGVLAFAYAAIIALVFDCRWPLQHWRLGVLAAVLSAVCLACLVLIPHATPVSMSRLAVPSGASGGVQLAIAGCLYLWGIFYALFLLTQLWRFRHAPLLRFELATVLLYLLPLGTLGWGCIRYVVPVAPLLILLHVEQGQDSPWRVVRMALACVFGLVLLLQLPELPNNIPDLRERIRRDPIFEGHQPPSCATPRSSANPDCCGWSGSC